MDERLSQEREYWDNTYRIVSFEENTINIFPDCLEPHRHTTRFLYSLLGRIHNKRVLSVGGGIDRFGVHVAKNNNLVTTVDVSPEAAKRTLALAGEHGVDHRVTALTTACEEMTFDGQFDVVLSRHALHHMDFYRCMDRIQAALVAGGTFLMNEPVCLSAFLQLMHDTLPFHPEPLCFSDNEGELTRKELAHIESTFRQVSFHYFDLLTRESVMYAVYKLGLKKMLPLAGRIDAAMLKLIPFLRPLSSYIIVSAVKP